MNERTKDSAKGTWEQVGEDSREMVCVEKMWNVSGQCPVSD